jgi:hypothetical protein
LVALDDELIKFPQLKPGTARRYCRIGKIPSARFGRRRYVQAGAIDRFLDAQVAAGSRP